MSSPQPAKNLPFILGAIIIAGLLAFGMYKYLTKDTKKKNMNTMMNKPFSKRMIPMSSPPSSPSGICDSCSDCDCLKKNNCSNYQSACVGPCGQYEDNGACSQDGIKAYNNALMGQLDYICKASGKTNQVQECMEMCENGQFGGLPMCQSCCQAVCMNINCPPSGGGGPLPPPPRPDGKAGCAECATICRDDPTGIYGISCDQCNRSCA